MSSRPTRRTLLTHWGERLDRDSPLPEYPRPQLRRTSYLCLNGPWEYAVTTSQASPDRFDGTITVPFSPEAPLSGVGRVVTPDEVLHYRRRFRIPEGWVADTDDHVLLHIDAVDQTCEVWVNARCVARHDGGYLPVTADITEALRQGDNEVRVAVTDPTDTGPGSRGKQRLQAGGIWYTPQSGIWQTVWLEAVPSVHVGRLTIVPLLDDGAVEVTVHVVDLDGDGRGRDVDVEPACTVTLLADDMVVACESTRAGRPVRLHVPEPRAWSPEDPYLYDLTVDVGRDRVASYTGLRSFGVGPDSEGHPRLLLNGRPYFHAGVLDQGYWPDGLLTPPSDEAMVHDITTMKRLGFTMLRKHVTVEPLRWYYHCDRLGMLVWQDMVNGGGPYRSSVTTAPAVGPVHLRDRAHRLFGRGDAAARGAWLRELAATIEHLRNVVSLAVWVPFNEGWGQFDAAWVADQVRRLDPKRTVDHASGWHDQGAGDLTSIHVYVRPFRVPRPRPSTAHRALVLSEYGGYSYRVDDHSVGSTGFGYRMYQSVQALGDAFTRLHDQQVVPAIERGLAATVYTQVSDVEDETNGLLTFDRRVQKLPDKVVQAVTSRLRLD